VIEDVLVPHDLTPFGDRALEAIAKLGLTYRRLHVVHVLPRVDLSYPGVVWSKDEDSSRQSHALQVLEDRLARTPFAAASCHVQVGDVAARVLEVAREVGAELVVLPTHARGGLNRLVRGSVADHVSRFASCPVLVLPPHADTTTTTRVAVAPHEEPERTPEEQVDRLGAEVTTLAEQNSGYLVALRIAIPAALDPEWWDEAITRRLAATKIDYVDLTLEVGPGPRAEILHARFEEAWAE
jgi:nucleotide-binding universal stress UspA family protein